MKRGPLPYRDLLHTLFWLLASLLTFGSVLRVPVRE